MKSHDKGNNAGNSKPSNQAKPPPDKPNPEKTVSVVTLFSLVHVDEFQNALCL